MDLGLRLTIRETPDAARPPVDVSVIIAHRGPELGLWLTLESCEADLKDSGLTYEYIVVANGEDRLSEDLQIQKHWLQANGHYGDFVHVVEPLSPPSARQVGTWSAKGKYLFFFDNHCIVQAPYFTRAISSMETYGIGMLHSTTNFWMGQGNYYEYRMAFKKHFWVDQSLPTAGHESVPYQVGVAGHGAFAVTRELWDKVDGYWMGFQGYAGEEPYFDLKCWMMGESVWLDPLMVHKHWSGRRSYNRHYTDDYITNLLSAANIIGGEKWLYDVGDKFMFSTRLIPQDGSAPKPMIDLIEEAYNRSSERAAWLKQRSVRSFDECLQHFNENGIRI